MLPERQEDGPAALDESALGRWAERLKAPLEQQLAEARARRPDLRTVVAWVAAAECGCERARRLLEGALALAEVPGLKRELARIYGVHSRLVDLARDRYRSVIEALKADLAIFLGTNLGAFLMVLAVASLRRDRARAAVVPAFLILVAVAVSSGIYLFGQDWFYAILFESYMGVTYLVLVGFITLALLAVFFAPKTTAKATTVVGEALGAFANALAAIPFPGC